jgi:ribosomal-protein-alanine N-acetyltransferase
MNLLIAPYTEADRTAVIAGNIDLQETERAVSEFCLPGEDIGEKYLDYLLKLNNENSGAILVAKIDGKVVGFIGCRIEYDESVTTTAESNTFSYISDAWTHPEHRKQGIFKALNKAAEDYFKQFSHITIVKLNVLARNLPAIAAYEGTGYNTQELTLVKRIR